MATFYIILQCPGEVSHWWQAVTCVHSHWFCSHYVVRTFCKFFIFFYTCTCLLTSFYFPVFLSSPFSLCLSTCKSCCPYNYLYMCVLLHEWQELFNMFNSVPIAVYNTCYITDFTCMWYLAVLGIYFDYVFFLCYPPPDTCTYSFFNFPLSPCIKTYGRRLGGAVVVCMFFNSSWLYMCLYDFLVSSYETSRVLVDQHLFIYLCIEVNYNNHHLFLQSVPGHFWIWPQGGTVNHIPVKSTHWRCKEGLFT